MWRLWQRRPARKCDSRVHKISTLYFDKYVPAILAGLPVKNAIVFCRSELHQIDICEYLKEKLPDFSPDIAPYVMNHANIGKVTAKNILERRNEISLFVSTTKMLMGVDLEKIDIIIFVRALGMLHYFVQGAGRAGRRSSVGRRKVIVYVLVNASDIASNVPGMDESVRGFCTTVDCLNEYLEKYFDGQVTSPKRQSWCCGNCDDN